MFDATHEEISAHVCRYRIVSDGKPLSVANVLGLWQHDREFCSCYLSLLSECPFSAYRWETPPVTRATVDREFEFVLLDSPGLSRSPDTEPFAEFFTLDDTDQGIVAFENLGKDAKLVVPSPRGPSSAYVHLAAFIRHAPVAQRIALWQVVGNTVAQTVDERPLWVNTAGGGVAWLHVRLDSRPKYYGYSPYKRLA